MKSDTERKKYHTEKMHKRKKRLRAHLSAELRKKLKNKKRAILLHKGDRVKIMRGPQKGKEAKVSRVNTVRRKIFLEGVMVRNARGKEMVLPLEPSNLLIIGIEPTPERKKIFVEDAFKKIEVKPQKKPEAKKAVEVKKEVKSEEVKKTEEKKEKPSPPPIAKSGSPKVKGREPPSNTKKIR